MRIFLSRVTVLWPYRGDASGPPLMGLSWTARRATCESTRYLPPIRALRLAASIGDWRPNKEPRPMTRYLAKVSERPPRGCSADGRRFWTPRRCRRLCLCSSRGRACGDQERGCQNRTSRRRNCFRASGPVIAPRSAIFTARPRRGARECWVGWPLSGDLSGRWAYCKKESNARSRKKFMDCRVLGIGGVLLCRPAIADR